MASTRPDLLAELVQDDINTEFQVPFPVNLVRMIVNRVLSPYGITDQSSINKVGERIEKNCIIHDQSFEFSEGNSVNVRLICDDFLELRYGRYLS